MSARWHPSRLGLAGGIDKDGSRAAELLAAGFGSVEFGTVTPWPEPGANPGAAALAARLAGRRAGATRIGIGIGMGAGAPDALAAAWLGGMRAAWPAADYLSFNLSARSYRPLLAAAHLPLLLHAFDAVTAEREALGRHIGLALKLPLGPDGDFPLMLAGAAAAAGFDAVIAVLPEGAGRLARLEALASCLQGKAALVAVGGIRGAADLRDALGAGADGVQVHTVFAQQGAACVPLLLG